MRLAAPLALARAVKLTWDPYLAGNFRVEGESLHGSVAPAGIEYVINLDDAPYGTRWHVGTREGAAASGHGEIRLDVRERLGRATVAELEKIDPDATLVLETSSWRA